MNTYRITNITDKLGKRDDNFNKTLKISYTDEMVKKELHLKPKDTVYFTADSLPLSVHKFRVKNLVSVSEISQKELEDIREKKKLNNKSQKETSTTTSTSTKKPKSTTSKKSSNKSTTSSKSSSSRSSSKSSYSKSTTTTTTEKEEDEE